MGPKLEERGDGKEGSREREMQMRMSKPSPDCGCVLVAYVLKDL